MHFEQRLATSMASAELLSEKFNCRVSVSSCCLFLSFGESEEIANREDNLFIESNLQEMMLQHHKF